MKLLGFIAFMFIGFHSFSMGEMTERKEVETTLSMEKTFHADKKKRLNKKRKRKCSQWGSKSFAG